MDTTTIALYPDNHYDRWWHSSGKIEGVVTVARDNMNFIQSFMDILVKAFAHAITPESSKATTLTGFRNILGGCNLLLHFLFHGSVGGAYQNKSRSFDFLADGIKRNDDPIIPPYRSNVTDCNLHGLPPLLISSLSVSVGRTVLGLRPLLN